MPSPGSSLARVQKDRFVPAGAAADELNFDQLMRRAEILAVSGLVPKALENNPQGIALVGMRGAELGFSLGYSLENIDVIEGKATPNAQARLTLLRKHGHEARFTESTSERATLRARRKEYRNDPDGWVTFTYTIEDARRAELAVMWVETWQIPPGGDRKKKMKFVFGDDRGPNETLVAVAPVWAKKLIEAGPDAWMTKDNWRKDPASMIRAACIRHITKMEFSDVMAGLAVEAGGFFSDDEVDEEIDVVPTPSDVEDDGITDAEIVDDPPPAAVEECPVPGCTIDGSHDHDSWVEGQPEAPAEPQTSSSNPDPKTWTGDEWREVLATAGVKNVAALKEARRLADEAGLPLPNALDELEGSDVAPALAARLGSLA